jgi:two-component system, chemotaxis family, chemotaxis protein CheY
MHGGCAFPIPGPASSVDQRSVEPTRYADTALKLVVEIAIENLGATRFAIYLRDDSSDELCAVVAEGADLDAFPPFRLGRGRLGEALSTCEVTRFDLNDERDPRAPRLCVPLVAAGRPIGAIVAQALRDPGTAHTLLDRQRLTAFGCAAGAAIAAAWQPDSGGAPAEDDPGLHRADRGLAPGLMLGLRSPKHPGMAKHRILIVEDSPTMRQLLVFAMRRRRDIEVVEAHDGMDGLRKLAEDHFSLALVDISMPVMDGLKLIQMIRNDATLHQLPIAVVTTEGAKEDRERALALGANAYLTKPVQAQRVLETVESLLATAERGEQG